MNRSSRKSCYFACADRAHHTPIRGDLQTENWRGVRMEVS
ncbi:MAG: hypothetical protein [Olavius algarvensis Delta 4 endosymbiont]|nr:MAG: hypothetical protein [Olavius algarvensis Delta 4 endosymbiont]